MVVLALGIGTVAFAVLALVVSRVAAPPDRPDPARTALRAASTVGLIALAVVAWSQGALLAATVAGLAGTAFAIGLPRVATSGRRSRSRAVASFRKAT